MNNATFQTTHWSVVLAAKGDDTKAAIALRMLCESYREPILRYVGRIIAKDTVNRYGVRTAEDLTHDFILQLLEKNMFRQFERRECRFRTYLLGAVQHFLANVRQRESSAKRGGGIVHIPIEDDSCPSEDETMFDRDWAQSMVDQAIQSLGNSRESQTLLPWLTQELSAADRTTIATALGMNETAIKVALHRLRKKFRTNIREQIARTVESESQIDDELAYLVRILM